MTEEEVATILQVRRKRSELFGADLFSNPAWDILLELFAAELGNRDMRLSELPPIAPKSTLARWVSALEERALICCELDPERSGDVRLALSRECAAKLSRFFSALLDPRR